MKTNDKVCKKCRVTKSATAFTTGHRKCKKCRAIIEKGKRVDRRANGLCWYCRNPVVPGQSICEDHWWGMVGRKTSVSVEELKAVLDAQGGCCPYTGVVLEPSSMSIVDGPDKGLMWVWEPIGKMRGGVSHSSFVSLCWKVVESDS